MDLIKVSEFEKKVMRFFLFSVALLWVFPVYSAIRNSLLVNGIDNYIFIFTEKIGGISIFQTFWNSGFIAFFNSLLILLIGALAAFAFSKMDFFGKEVIYIIVLMCLAVPAIVVIVPYFFIMNKLGLYNSLWAIIWSQVSLTLPFAILILRNFFDGLPSELMESARIDGANILQIFYKIYLPLSKPALINLGILCVMWSFQDFLLPMMFLSDKELTTATLAISNFKGVYGMSPAEMGKFNAALVVLGLPAVIVFIAFQKFITKGITSGAVK